MMLKKRIIDANGARYIGQIPEFKNELPKGILNKRITDTGGTFAALNYPSNYVVVVPFIGIIDSIRDDKNVQYDVFYIKGGVKEIDFIKYLENNKVYKIVVTYDSFYKVSKWLKTQGYKTNDFKVLIDEFHLALEHYGFRQNAINSLIKITKNFDHVTYMSSTPSNDIFIPKFLKKEPYTTIKWRNIDKVSVYPFNNYNTKTTLINILQIFLKRSGLVLKDINDQDTKVQETFIFVNSVKYIASIIKTLKLETDDVKVVCRNDMKNVKIIEDAGAEISKVTDSNKKINFFTSTAFEGCNLFSNNGLVLVVSDPNYKSTLIDLETTFVQISGRLRLNDEYQNVFRNTMIHILNTGQDIYDYLGQNTFKYHDYTVKKINSSIKNSKNIITSYNKLDKKEKETFRETHYDNSFYAIYNDDKDRYEMSPMIIEYRDYLTHKIKMYHNSTTVLNSYSKDHFEYMGFRKCPTVNNIKIKLAIQVNFKDLLIEYIEFKEDDPNHIYVSQYEAEYPLFKEAYNILGSKGISACSFSKTKIERKLNAFSKSNVNKVISNIFSDLDDKKFISGSDLKSRIIDEYDKLNIEIKKIGFTNPRIIALCSSYSFTKTQRRINKKQTYGYILRLDLSDIYNKTS